MDPIVAALICLGLMLLMLNTGVPIAIAVGFSSMIVGYFTIGPMALEKLGWTTFQTVFNPAWTALPLFTFIGSLLAHTRIGEDLFAAARLWLSKVPGGLVIASLFGQAGMGAVLGASAQTILAIGPVSMPELEKYKYDRSLSLGALTCGGVLGPLIPPSATFIIISGITNIPLGPLLIAGVVPGILLAFMLSLVPIVRCSINPELGPMPGPVRWGERFGSLKRIWPVVITFCIILGSIFFGICTATEAGGVGALVVLLVAVIVYGVRGRQIYRAMIDTVAINSQILFILVGASFFSYIIGSSNMARQLAGITNVIHSPVLIVIFIMALLLILGCFIDGMTILMITIPIFLPMVTTMGFHPIWFAVLFAVNMEMGLITPPMGINFFLVRSLFKIDAGALFKGVWPFAMMIVLFLLVLILFPNITLWLPGMMSPA